MLKQLGLDIAAAIAFYTCIPVPGVEKLDFSGVARLAPTVGLLIGGVLGLFDALMNSF